MMKKRIILFSLIVLIFSVGTPAQEMETIRIGALSKGLNNPFFEQMVAGYEFSAERYNVEILIEATDENQVDVVTDWLENEDLDVLIFTPLNSENLLDELALASEMGIPLINVDELLPQDLIDELDLNVLTQIASNNVRAGTLAANYSVDNLPQGTEIAIIEGIPGVQSSIDRVQGYLLNAERNGLRVVTSQPASWETDLAYEVTLGILEQFPDIGGIFAANDTMGLGAIQALEDNNREGVIVISVDGITEAREAIADERLVGSVTQFPFEMAVLAVEAAIKVAEGRPIAPFIESPVGLITIDNLD